MSGSGSTPKLVVPIPSGVSYRSRPAWQRGYPSGDVEGQWSATWGYDPWEQPTSWFVIRAQKRHGVWDNDRFELLFRVNNFDEPHWGSVQLDRS